MLEKKVEKRACATFKLVGLCNTMSKKVNCSIRVHILEVRDIRGVDASGMSDPTVTVQFCGDRRSTRPLDQVCCARQCSPTGVVGAHCIVL